jgi:hypothetical protein
VSLSAGATSQILANLNPTRKEEVCDCVATGNPEPGV